MPLAKPIDRKYVSNTKTLGILLYLFLIPPIISVVLALFSLQIKAFFLNFVAFLLFYAALYFSKKGFAAEFSYHQASFAKAPKPFKLTGALFLSAATFYSAFMLAHFSFFQSIFLAFVAFVGYYLWYGFDPRHDKVPDTGDVGVDVAYETLQNAKEKLNECQELAKDVRNYELRHRLEETLQKASTILTELEKRPAYVRRLRKFLVVYIDSLYDVTQSYVKTQEDVNEHLKQNLYTLLESAEARFEKELEKVRNQEHEELDTKIKVFDKQIKEL